MASAPAGDPERLDRFQLAFVRVGSVLLLLGPIAAALNELKLGVKPPVYGLVPFMLVGAASLALLYARQQRAAVVVLAIGVWLATFNTMWWTVGVYAPAGGILAIVVLFSGWLLGTRATILLTIATLLALFVFAAGARMGVLPLPPPPMPPPVHYALVRSLIIVGAGALGYYAARSLSARVERLAMSERVLRDKVSELASRERELESARAHFETLFRSSPSAAALAEIGSGRILDCNDAFVALLGRPRAEIVGRESLEIGYWRDPAARERAYRLLARDGTVRSFEAEFLRPDGEVRACLIHWEVIVLNGAERLLAQIFDVTDARRASRELVRLNAELERLNRELEARVARRTADLQAANQELDSFAHSVAHDLRAPLRAISGFATVLSEDLAGRLSPDENASFERIRASAARMGLLISDLLALSRIGRAELRFGTVDLSALASEIAAELSAQASGRRVEWRIEPGVRAQADPGLIRVLLANLLGNAWKYTRKRERTWIEFASLPADVGMIECRVRDNGAGFDMAHAERMFEPFRRLHGATEFEGTGIGLATVKRIVLRHGGRVWAEGRPDEGATIYFTLPVTDATAA